MARWLLRCIQVFVLTLGVLQGLGCEQRSDRPRPIPKDGLPSQKPQAAPFVSGQREYTQLNGAEVPQEVRDRQAETEKHTPAPKSAPFTCEVDSTKLPFRVHHPKLLINLDKQEMTFDFELQSKNGVERVNLKGDFDRTESPWRADLYSTDQKILESRRVQAVALCVNANICDVLAVNIYYVLDGQGYCRQLQSGVSGATLAASGDLAEDETHEIDTEAADAADVAGDSNLSDPDYWRDRVNQIGQDARKAPDATSRPRPARPSRIQQPVPIRPQPMSPNVPATREEDVSAMGDASEPDQAQASAPVTRPRKNKKVTPAPRLEDVPADERRDAAIQYSGAINIEPPKATRYSIESLPAPVARTESGVIGQAIGVHNAGYLRRATAIPAQGSGYVLTDLNKSRYGTERSKEFIEALANDVYSRLGDRLQISSVSRETGGRRPGYPFGSHQTGLDIDLYYLQKDSKDLPSGIPEHLRYSGSNGSRLTPPFDIGKNWELAKSVLRVKREWMIVMFMDRTIKRAFCQFAKQAGEDLQSPNSLAFQTLRAIVHTDGHHHHTHIRLYCPGNQGCGNTMVSLPNKTGC